MLTSLLKVLALVLAFAVMGCSDTGSGSDITAGTGADSGDVVVEAADSEAVAVADGAIPSGDADAAAVPDSDSSTATDAIWADGPVLGDGQQGDDIADATASGDGEAALDIDSAVAEVQVADGSDGAVLEGIVDAQPVDSINEIVDSLVEATATSALGPWLGPCQPTAQLGFGNPAAAKGYAVPVTTCAKPGWPSVATKAAPTWQLANQSLGMGVKPALMDPCLLWRDLTGDGKADLLTVEQPASPGAKRYVRLFVAGSGETWQLQSIPLGASGSALDCFAVDWDADGDVDVALTTMSGVRILRNENNMFTDMPSLVSPELKGISVNSGAVFDFDRDGDHDVYFARTGEMNLQPGQFACGAADYPYKQCCYGGAQLDAACLAKIEATPIATYTCCQPSALGSSNALLRNDKGSMVDITALADADDFGATLTTAVSDIDRDGWPDLFCGNDFGPLGWFRSLGSSKFEYLSQQVGLRPYGHCMGVGLGDLNSDGHTDLTHSDLGPVTLALGKAGGGWQDAGNSLGTWTLTIDAVAWAQLVADLDSDGWLDLWTTTSMVAQPGKIAAALQSKNPMGLMAAGYDILHHNVGGSFVAQAMPWPNPMEHNVLMTSVAASDWDGDGDLDIATIAASGDLRLLRNTTASGHWLKVGLVPKESALGGLGTRVQVWAQGYAQEREVQWTAGTGTSGEFTQHIGLGAVTKLDMVVVWWPSGKMQVLGPQGADQKLTLYELNAAGPKP